MQIWDAILKGCEKTKPLYGSFFGTRLNPETGETELYACVVGAASYGLTGKQSRLLVLGTLFPELRGYNMKCPVEGCPTNDLGWLNCENIMIHLNDIHLWRREDIAFWLRDQLEPKPEKVKEPELEEVCQ